MSGRADGNSGSALNPYDETLAVITAIGRAETINSAVHVLKHIGGLVRGRQVAAGGFYRWKDATDEEGRAFPLPPGFELVRTVKPGDSFPTSGTESVTPSVDVPAGVSMTASTPIDPIQEVRDLAQRLTEAGADDAIVLALEDVARIAERIHAEEEPDAAIIAAPDAGETTGGTPTPDSVDVQGTEPHQP